MSVSQGFGIVRYDPTANPNTGLAANVKFPIIVPRLARRVNILNGTTGALQVHTTDEDDVHFISINSNFERDFAAEEYKFHKGAVGFWLKPAVSGLIILVWY